MFMHISDGLLPIGHAVAWTAAALPFVARSISRLDEELRPGSPARVPVVAAAAFTLALSALKLPSVTGSCSHLTGVGFGALTVGASRMPAISLAVLLMQALALAHGGITTLGANVLSMGVCGPFAPAGAGWLCCRVSCPSSWRAFAMAFTGCLVPYLVTAVQLGLAQPGVDGPVAAILRYLAIFGLTQVPLATVEGIVTVYVLRWVGARAPQGATA
jgi:cobalt/nickel transport system permease protein